MPQGQKQEKISDTVKSVGLSPSQMEHLVMAYLCMEKPKVSERMCAWICRVFELNASLLIPDRLTGRSLGSFARLHLPLLELSSPRADDASRDGRIREPPGQLPRKPKKPRKPEKMKKSNKPKKPSMRRTITRILWRLWRLHTQRILRIRMEGDLSVVGPNHWLTL